MTPQPPRRRKLTKREMFKRWKYRRNLRCAHCSGGFRLDEDLFSYSSSDKTWHEFCMAYLAKKREFADLLAYIQGTADRDAVFRVEHIYLGIDVLSGPRA